METIVLKGEPPIRVTMTEVRARAYAKEGFLLQLLPLSIATVFVGALALPVGLPIAALVFLIVAPILSMASYFAHLHLLKRCKLEVVGGQFSIQNRIWRHSGLAREIISVGVGRGYGLRRADGWAIFVGQTGQVRCLESLALDEPSAEALREMILGDGSSNNSH